MKLSFATVVAVALGTAFIAAQTPQQGETVTVAGCLQRAQRNGSVGGTVVGTSAAPNTADDEANSGVMVDAYLLSEAAPVVAGTAQPPAGATTADRGNSQAATAAGTSGKSEITSFGLSGRESELERHQGARLQVTGTIMPPANSGRGTGGSATASGVKRIRVESFKVLADKCHAN
jgi:hypothetical protein